MKIFKRAITFLFFFSAGGLTVRSTSVNMILTARSNNVKRGRKKFKNLNFNISIDGVGPVFEYLRYPLSWSTLLDNLDFFRTVTNNISTSYTTSNLNVLYHHDTTAWFDQQGLNYHFSPVINPVHFRPDALPRSVKDEIFKRHGHTKDLDFLLGSQHNQQDDADFENLLKHIKKQDQVKGISIHDYLPEFCKLVAIP